MSVVANVAINVDSSNAVTKLRQVQTQAQATERAFGALQGALGAFGVGFALTKVIADVKELDTNLRRLGTVGGDVGALDKGLGQLSKNLDGIASKAELAAASYQALSAGFTDTAGNIKIVEAANKAAIGGLADTTQVTAVLTKTLNAYNLSGSQAIKVTDSISKAVEFGQVEWSDYTTQLGRVASIAAIAGVSLDEVNAFVASATKNGATAEIAFTGLGATLNTLLQPTKESKDAAAELGIQWNLAGLKGKGFSGLLAELALKTGTNQEAAVRLLGSQEALRGAFAAAAKGGKDYKDALQAISGAAGKTDSDFKVLKDSLENQLKALDTAFKNLSEALGKAFGPTVIDTIGDVTGAINGFAEIINAIPQPVATAVAEIVKFIAQALLLQKAIQGIIALRAGLIGVLTATTTSVAATGTASATATPLVNGLAAALKNLALIGVVTVGVNYVSNVVGEALSLQELQKRRERGGAAGEFKGASRETVVAAQEAQRKELERLKKQDEQRRKKLGQNPLYNIPLVGPLAISAMSPFIAGEQQKIGERAQFAQGVLGLDPNKFPSTAKPPATLTGGGGVTGMEDTTKKKRGKTDAEKLAEEAAKQLKSAQDLNFEQDKTLALLSAQNEYEKAFTQFGTQRTEIERKYNELLASSKSATETKVLQEAKSKELKTADLTLQQQITDLLKQAQAPLNDAVETLKNQAAYEREYGELIKNGTNPELAKQLLEIKKGYNESVKLLEPALAAAQAAVTKAEAEGASATEIKKYREELERIEAIRKGLEGKKGEGEQAAKDAAAAKEAADKAAKTPSAIINKEIDSISKQLAELTNIGNIAVTVANGIGTAFSQAFQGLITGSMSAQEALASFFASVGDMFISMATEIIAKQMTMIVLQSILKALGAVSGGSSTPIPIPGSVDTVAAKGMIANNGIQPFASGGIVNSPTLFKFADGGTTKTGLMGEAGPEAIMPLKRGSDGKLGVVSQQQNDALNRYRPTGAISGIVQPDTSPDPGTNAVTGAGIIDVRYHSEVINNTEYVTASQFQTGIQQAAMQGAQQGERRALRSLQQSTTVRRRIGIR